MAFSTCNGDSEAHRPRSLTRASASNITVGSQRLLHKYECVALTAASK